MFSRFSRSPFLSISINTSLSIRLYQYAFPLCSIFSFFFLANINPKVPAVRDIDSQLSCTVGIAMTRQSQTPKKTRESSHQNNSNRVTKNGHRSVSSTERRKQPSHARTTQRQRPPERQKINLFDDDDLSLTDLDSDHDEPEGAASLMEVDEDEDEEEDEEFTDDGKAPFHQHTYKPPLCTPNYILDLSATEKETEKEAVEATAKKVLDKKTAGLMRNSSLKGTDALVRLAAQNQISCGWMLINNIADQEGTGDEARSGSRRT